MNPDYDALLNELARLGFCGSVIDDEPSHVDFLLPRQGTVRAETFADLVLQAEGFDPHGAEAVQFRRPIRNAFIRHMGTNEVDVSLLK
jgi:hypothetical protein